MGLSVAAAAPVKPEMVELGPEGVLVGLPVLPGEELMDRVLLLGGGELPVPVAEAEVEGQ